MSQPGKMSLKMSRDSGWTEPCLQVVSRVVTPGLRCIARQLEEVTQDQGQRRHPGVPREVAAAVYEEELHVLQAGNLADAQMLEQIRLVEAAVVAFAGLCTVTLLWSFVSPVDMGFLDALWRAHRPRVGSEQLWKRDAANI